MVAIARVLMSRPRMIVVDEPTMGLSTLYVDRVLELIRTINQEGRVDLHGRAECEPRT
jgi:branched-chain amino acid transport system ATP-binding protein